MRKLLFAVVVSLLFTSSLFATKGEPWNQDYPCPDLDCSSMTATGWADGMYVCSVKGSWGGKCVTCAQDAVTNKSICVKLQESYSCKCTVSYVDGVRKCSAKIRCNYIP